MAGLGWIPVKRSAMRSLCAEEKIAFSLFRAMKSRGFRHVRPRVIDNHLNRVFYGFLLFYASGGAIRAPTIFAVLGLTTLSWPYVVSSRLHPPQTIEVARHRKT